MLLLVSRAQLTDQQVKSYHAKGYFQKLHQGHKGRALSEKKKEEEKRWQEEYNALDMYIPLLQQPWKLGSCANLLLSRFGDSCIGVGRRLGCVSTTTTLLLILSDLNWLRWLDYLGNTQSAGRRLMHTGRETVGLCHYHYHPLPNPACSSTDLGGWITWIKPSDQSDCVTTTITLFLTLSVLPLTWVAELPG